MREDLGLQSEFANGFAICPGLFRGDWGSQLDVFHAESIEGLGNCDFSFGIEESIGKLFSLCYIK